MRRQPLETPPSISLARNLCHENDLSSDVEAPQVGRHLCSYSRSSGPRCTPASSIGATTRDGTRPAGWSRSSRADRCTSIALAAGHQPWCSRQDWETSASHRGTPCCRNSRHSAAPAPTIGPAPGGAILRASVQCQRRWSTTSTPYSPSPANLDRTFSWGTRSVGRSSGTTRCTIRERSPDWFSSTDRTRINSSE